MYYSVVASDLLGAISSWSCLRASHQSSIHSCYCPHDRVNITFYCFAFLFCYALISLRSSRNFATTYLHCSRLSSRPLPCRPSPLSAIGGGPSNCRDAINCPSVKHGSQGKTLVCVKSFSTTQAIADRELSCYLPAVA